MTLNLRRTAAVWNDKARHAFQDLKHKINGDHTQYASASASGEFKLLNQTEVRAMIERGAQNRAQRDANKSAPAP